MNKSTKTAIFFVLIFFVVLIIGILVFDAVVVSDFMIARVVKQRNVGMKRWPKK